MGFFSPRGLLGVVLANAWASNVEAKIKENCENYHILILSLNVLVLDKQFLIYVWYEQSTNLTFGLNLPITKHLPFWLSHYTWILGWIIKPAISRICKWRFLMIELKLMVFDVITRINYMRSSIHHFQFVFKGLILRNVPK